MVVDEVDQDFFGTPQESLTKSGGRFPTNPQKPSTAAVSRCRSLLPAGVVERLSGPIPEDARVAVDGPLVPFVL